MSLFEILKPLILQNSYTGNKMGVDKIGKQFIDLLSPLDFNVTIHQRELIGDHLHFTSLDQETGEKILFLGHIDTVFPQGSFTTFREDEEWVYGPGVCDMKGGNLVAIEALKKCYQTNGKIVNIDLLFVSDEESGSDDSKALTASLASQYDLCLVFEAAGENNEVVTGRKGIGTFTIHIEGKASHAGNFYAQGIDANLEAARKLEKLVALTQLDKGSTVNVGKIEGGIGANTISPKSSITLELRYTSSSEKERLLQSINSIVSTSYVEGTKSSLTGSIQRDVMEPNDKQQEIIKRFETLTNTPLHTEQRGGVSDANITASHGLTTLDGFGPYGDGDHTIHERALKSSFYERIELVSQFIEDHQKNIGR
jgi:glutamate carboxypeptidase